MDEPDLTIGADALFVSSNMPPSRTEKRLAFAFALGVVATFFIVSHFADSRPHPIPGFVLAFSTAMFVCDTVAAILLFAQFVVLRSLGLLVIANAYVLTALILIPYTPDVSGPGRSRASDWRFAEHGASLHHMALWLSPICYRLRPAKGRE
jgi:hypothetical protein